MARKKNFSRSVVNAFNYVDRNIQTGLDKVTSASFDRNYVKPGAVAYGAYVSRVPLARLAQTAMIAGTGSGAEGLGMVALAQPEILFGVGAAAAPYLAYKALQRTRPLQRQIRKEGRKILRKIIYK